MIIIKKCSKFLCFEKKYLNLHKPKKDNKMRRLTKLTPINANLSVEIKLEECGDVYYRVVGIEEWKYSGYTIMESVHDYYIAKRRNRLDKVMQGTKRECLDAITEFVRTLFILCQGED